MRVALRTVALDLLRILTFRQPSAAISDSWPAYLALGLFFTWLAGVGRYWDNPRAAFWQHLGLGSIAYVFVLALILWLLLWPLKPRRWSFRNVLVFITLTAPPAILYAIPVERFMPLHAAQSVNGWFLAIVATWRVALLVSFLRNTAGLARGAIVVGTLLPLVLIVVALSALNLEHATFEIMAGVAHQPPSPNDTAYAIVSLISLFSMFAAPFLLAAYLWFAFRARFDALHHQAESVREAYGARESVTLLWDRYSRLSDRDERLATLRELEVQYERAGEDFGFAEAIERAAAEFSDEAVFETRPRPSDA